MFIKKISIEGFRSYRKRTIIKDVHPKINIIVGENGSGKSNLFEALRFVFNSDHFKNSSVFHESHGPISRYSSVEILFDNSSRKFPIDKDEIIVKHDLTVSRDKFYLNNIVSSKGEIEKLFNVSGLNYRSTYFLVPQHRLMDLANATSERRYHILRDISGVNIYDESRHEYEEMLEKVQLEKENMQPILNNIEHNIRKLDEQLNLKFSIESLLKLKNIIKRILLIRMVSEGEDELSKLEKTLMTFEKQSMNVNCEEHEELLRESEEKMKKLSIEEKRLRNELNEITICSDSKESILNGIVTELDDVSKERSDFVHRRKDIEETIETKTKNLVDYRKKMEMIKGSMKELKTVFQRKRMNVEKVQEEMEKEKNKVKFHNRKEYESYYRNKRNEELIQKKKIDEEYSRNVDQKNLICDNLEKAKELLERLNFDKLEKNKIQTELKEKLNQFNGKERMLIENRNRLATGNNRLSQKLEMLSKDLGSLSNRLRDVIGMEKFNLIKNIEELIKIIEENNNENERQIIENDFFGLVVDQLVIDEKLFIPVESLIGNQLFQVVCRSADCARLLMKEFNRHRMHGQLITIALDKIFKFTNYPRELLELNDATLMINQIKSTSNDLDELPKFLLKNSLLCDDFNKAVNLSGKHDVDVVLLSGQLVRRKAQSFRIGHHDIRRSSLRLYKQYVATIKEGEEMRKKLKEDQEEIHNVIEEIRSIHEKRNEFQKSLGKVQVDLVELNFLNSRTLSDKEDNERTFYELENEKLRELKERREEIDRQIESYTHSLEIASQTKDDDNENNNCSNKNNLEELSSKMRELNKMENDLNNKKQELTFHQTLVEQEEKFLDDLKQESKLIDYKLQFVNEKFSTLSTRKKEQLLNWDVKEVEKSNLTETVEKLNKENKDLENYINELSKQIEKNKKDDEKSKDEERLRKKTISVKNDILTLTNYAEQMKAYETNDEIVDELMSLRIEGEITIKEEFNFGNLKEMNRYQLRDCLTKIENFILKHNVVNSTDAKQHERHKKSYLELKEQYEKLNKQIVEFNNYIRRNDIRKSKILYESFRSVALNFSTFFRRFFPNGSAKLIIDKEDIQTIIDDEQNVSDDEMNDIMNNVFGIDIKVSFNKKENEAQRINALSGGQKSLVALCLIFSIQRLHPAPFYIFDEIDAVLDVHHRSKLHEILQESKETTQFFVTTFHPELLADADRYFLISFHHHTSSISSASPEELMAIIHKSAEKENTKEVTSVEE
ncbi:hypothetical protein SNEBB_002137 [Seison nebaliae]|nr:hypothetical protein SNEBB_002137 [Seison nebaliae]